MIVLPWPPQAKISSYAPAHTLFKSKYTTQYNEASNCFAKAPNPLCPAFPLLFYIISGSMSFSSTSLLQPTTLTIFIASISVVVVQNNGTHIVLLLFSLAKELAVVAEDGKSDKWGRWYCILLLMDDDIGWDETKNNVLLLLTFKPFAKECYYYICMCFIYI